MCFKVTQHLLLARPHRPVLLNTQAQRLSNFLQKIHRCSNVKKLLPRNLYRSKDYRSTSIRNMQQVFHAWRTNAKDARCCWDLGCWWGFMNTCRAPDLDMTSKWVSVASHRAFWTFSEVVSLQRCLVVRLHGWCHVKLLLSRRSFCVHHITMHQITVSFHSKPNMWVACV